jgi:hypothetical protein
MFGRYKGDRHKMRQTLGEDLLALVSRFAGNEAVASRSSYKAMVRVLAEQCEVKEETVAIKKQIGGQGLQNPSDPDATYCGHKGAGYNVQIAQTCAGGNDVQLITGVEVNPAHQSDQKAVEPMLDQLETHKRLPELMYADTNYGRDENVQTAQQRGVDLQSPLGGHEMEADKLSLDDFVIDEKTETVERCPNGCVPVSSQVDQATGRTRTVMRAQDCRACPCVEECPVHQAGKEFVLIHSAFQRRCAQRRAEQQTEAFAENYAIRAGMESTVSAVKRVTGMARLRTRGLKRVRLGAMLRCAGWNMRRAVAALTKRARKAATDFATALNAALQRVRRGCLGHCPGRMAAWTSPLSMLVNLRRLLPFRPTRPAHLAA